MRDKKRAATKTPLLVRRSDSKKGSLWHDFAHRRIIRQHGGDDIPEGDLHAVQKYESPVNLNTSTPEEIETALKDLKKEIDHLKKDDQLKQERLDQPDKLPERFGGFFDDDGDEPLERDTDRDDDL